MHETQTVSAYPAYTSFLAVTSPVVASMTRLPAPYAVAHPPEVLREHELIAPHKVA
jgi:hypothetical protein